MKKSRTTKPEPPASPVEERMHQRTIQVDGEKHVLLGELVPPCPSGSPELGSKDPAVIRWWFTYQPEEAHNRYDRIFEKLPHLRECVQDLIPNDHE